MLRRPVTLTMQKDSWAIDYQATKNVLDVARHCGASHFVLLSAICVQKPLLEFQHAKLKFETELQAAGDITYSIVRPTAFFKSLAGQVCNTADFPVETLIPLPLVQPTPWHSARFGRKCRNRGSLVMRGMGAAFCWLDHSLCLCSSTISTAPAGLTFVNFAVLQL
jgi:hypothetical protein